MKEIILTQLVFNIPTTNWFIYLNINNNQVISEISAETAKHIINSLKENELEIEGTTDNSDIFYTTINIKNN